MSYQPLRVDLSGRVALVTGANSGMGKETACELARMGAAVVLGCRSTERGEAARKEIIASTRATTVTVMEVDLSSMASVRGFASAFHERSPKLDVLVNNAAACGHARIVNISTLAAGGLDLSDTQFERRRYSGIAAYRASKQASRMLTWALADELKDEPVTANAVNPGYVLTPLTTNVTGLLKVLVVLTSFKAQSPVEGADTAIWAAGSPELEGVTGKFWNKRHEIRCRFRNTTEIQELRAVVEQQLSDADSFENTPLDRAARPEQAADTVRRASR